MVLISALSMLFFLAHCTDQFNDPNPKTQTVTDSIAPVISLTSPVDGGLYPSPDLALKMQFSDNFNLKSISVDIASIGKPAPGFSKQYFPGSNPFAIDTVYQAVLADTVDFQMLIIASDSAGNVTSKNVSYRMFKP